MTLESEKVDEYGGQKIENSKKCQLRESTVESVLIVIEASDSKPPKFQNHLDTLELSYYLAILLKSTVFRTACILSV